MTFEPRLAKNHQGRKEAGRVLGKLKSHSQRSWGAALGSQGQRHSVWFLRSGDLRLAWAQDCQHQGETRSHFPGKQTREANFNKMTSQSDGFRGQGPSLPTKTSQQLLGCCLVSSTHHPVATMCGPGCLQSRMSLCHCLPVGVWF